MHLANGLGGGQAFQLPRLIAEIIRGGLFLLTEGVTINRLAKLIYRVVYFRRWLPYNNRLRKTIFGGGYTITLASVNNFRRRACC